VREGLVFEIADRELDDGVLAVLGLEDRERIVWLVANGSSSQDGRSSPWRSRVRTLRTTSRRRFSVVSAICAMLVGG
jgi:hypothetical protein